MCLCSELLTTPSTNGSIDIYCLEKLLSSIHAYIESHKQLKTQLSFTLKGKSVKESYQRTAKIFQYSPNEYNTRILLQNNTQKWNEDPASFWIQPGEQRQQQYISTNPQYLIIFACLQLGFSDAHSSILRRFYCIVLVRLRATQYINDDAKTIAQSLYTTLNSQSQPIQNQNTFIDTVQGLIKAGSRYENIAARLGIGSLFLLGQDTGRLVWEKWLPKTGDLFEHAMNHLDHAGIVALGKTYEPLAKKVIHHLINRVSGPQIINSTQQIQQSHKRGYARWSSITEPAATKRLRRSDKSDNNDQSIVDQIRADNLKNQAFNCALGQSRQDITLSLPAPGPSVTIHGPAINADSATSKGNPVSITTLLNAADYIAGSTKGQQQIPEELGLCLSQPSNGVIHGQEGVNGSPPSGNANISTISQSEDFRDIKPLELDFAYSYAQKEKLIRNLQEPFLGPVIAVYHPECIRAMFLSDINEDVRISIIVGDKDARKIIEMLDLQKQPQGHSPGQVQLYSNIPKEKLWDLGGSLFEHSTLSHRYKLESGPRSTCISAFTSGSSGIDDGRTTFFIMVNRESGFELMNLFGMHQR
ncbi:hypothetical protein EAF04_005241 [Stromatinia cepivora]|nr:hypothetical protein EAF04_005241 [Stromatinia cepivora]